MYQVIQNFKPLYVDPATEKTDSLFSARQEDKFILPIAELPSLLAVLRDQFFSKVNVDDYVFKYRNVYLDTPDYRFYRMHRQGRYNRLKLRIRHYENGKSSRYLECKQKLKGCISTKKRKLIAIGQDYREVLEAAFLKDTLHQYSVDARSLSPVMSVSYSRLHFSSPINQIRLTLDFDLSVSLPEERFQPLMMNHVILEIKYVDEPREFMRWLRQSYGVRPLLSKYCVGMAYLYPHLKRNRWKQIFKHYICA